MIKQLLSVAAVTGLATMTSQAAVIAATNFDSRTLNGSSMDDIVWTTTDANGAQVTANTTAITSAASFKTNGGNPGQFAPDQNLHNGAGLWTGTFTLTVGTGYTADLTDITFDFDSRSSGGGLQGSTQIREITFDMTINGAAYGTQQGGDVAGAADYLATFTDSLQLAAGSHTLVITADGTGTGVFAPIDDLSINGAVTTVPEPSSAALLGLGGLALILRRRK